MVLIKIISTILYKLVYFGNKNISIKSSYFVLSRIRCNKTNTCSFFESYLKKTKLAIDGNNNCCNIHSTLVDSSVIVTGNNNRVEIRCVDIVRFLNLQVHGNNCSVIIEKGTAINGAKIICMGNGTKILIGKNCLFANHIDIWASDSHPIFNKDNLEEIVNLSKDIILEDHVWVCEKSSILKGVRIGTNSIVGMGAVVTHDIPPFSIAVGNPARVIKNNITWSRIHSDC